MKKKILILFSLIFILNTILALDVSQVSNGNGRGVYITPEEPPVSTNVSQEYTNSSDFWDNLDTPEDMPLYYNHTSLATTDWGLANDTYVNVDGDTMTGDLTVDTIIDIHAPTTSTTCMGENTCSSLSGVQNTVYGSSAGRDLLAGTGNTFIGTGAGQNIENGAGNTLIGQGAGAFLVAQGTQTYIGQFAGRYQTGDNNMCLGAFSCEGVFGETNNGNNNFYAGHSAGRYNVGGVNNMCLGASCMQDSATASYSVAIGTSALRAFQGQNTIAIGERAGRYYNGTGSIFIGQGIGFSKDLPDNVLMIDNEDGLNDTLIFGNFEGNNLTINGDLHTTGNFSGNQYYGELWFDDESPSGTITPIAETMQWYNISGFNHTDPVGGDLLNGVYEGGDGELIPDVGGVYNVNYEISFERSDGAVSREYEIGLAVNGEVQNKSQSHRTIGNANDVGDAGQTVKLILNGGDRVQMVIRNNGGTENAGVHNAVLGMDRIGN